MFVIYNECKQYIYEKLNYVYNTFEQEYHTEIVCPGDKNLSLLSTYITFKDELFLLYYIGYSLKSVEDINLFLI